MLLKNSRFTEHSILYLKTANLQIWYCLKLIAIFHIKMIHEQFLVYKRFDLVWFIVFNATFNNISVILCRSVLLMEETRVPGKNHLPVASH